MSTRSTNPEAAPAFRDRARKRLAERRARYAASWPAQIGYQLKRLDFVDWVTLFGAELLWSALPLIILLSSLGNQRIDDDLSRHIGLNSQGAHILETLFRGTPSHGVVAIVTGFLFCLAGVIATVGSLELMYERVFGQEPRGWRNLPRRFLWLVAVLLLLVFDGVTHRAERDAGAGVLDVVGLITTTLFFWWTLHFLLGGRVPWRRLVRPALASGLLWFGFAVFSSLYFSPVMVSDSHTYGTIGVVFSLLTWLFLIGAVIVLGAVLGASWQAHAERAPTEPA